MELRFLKHLMIISLLFVCGTLSVHADVAPDPIGTAVSAGSYLLVPAAVAAAALLLLAYFRKKKK